MRFENEIRLDLLGRNRSNALYYVALILCMTTVLLLAYHCPEICPTKKVFDLLRRDHIKQWKKLN